MIMNRLFNAIENTVSRDRGDKGILTLLFLLEHCRQNAYEYIPMSIFNDCTRRAGEEKPKEFLEYLVTKLGLFDFYFRLYLDDDSHIDVDYGTVQFILNEDYCEIGGAIYSKDYINKNAVVFLSPKKRFRKVVEWGKK